MFFIKKYIILIICLITGCSQNNKVFKENIESNSISFLKENDNILLILKNQYTSLLILSDDFDLDNNQIIKN